MTAEKPSKNSRSDGLRLALVELYGPAIGALMHSRAMEMPEPRQRRRYLRAMLTHPKLPLVDVATFARHEAYWGMGSELYPALIPHLTELNSGKYVEAIIVGGIGSGKTTLGQVSCAYQLYLLSRVPNPQDLFGLESASEIVFIFQNITHALAQAVDFARFRERIFNSPYFQRHFPPDPSLRSELRFPNRIVVKPVSGSSLAAIGQNVIGGLLDEVNYMAVVDSSTKSFDNGVYNQAIENYNAIARRRKSRFYKKGVMPGVLCLVSSNKYPGQFTDKKMEEREAEIANLGKSSIYHYNLRVWDLKPDAYSAERFRVFTGDEFRKPRILGKAEAGLEFAFNRVVEVPEDFRKEFEDDIVNALREIAGVSHISRSPFFTNPELLAKMFTARPSIFSRDAVDFDSTQLQIIRSAIKEPRIPRFAHVDLAATGDSTGVAIGYCPGFAKVPRGGTVETLPRIVLDGVLEVQPPKGGEIAFHKIRRIFCALRDLGVNLKWIRYDNWQSRDSLQLLRQEGFCTGEQSMDRTTDPAVIFKSAVNDGRVECPKNTKLHRELRELQINHKDSKIDHLPGRSKDLSDAVMGVCYGLSMRLEIYALYEIPLCNVAPSIVSLINAPKARRFDE